MNLLILFERTVSDVIVSVLLHEKGLNECFFAGSGSARSYANDSAPVMWGGANSWQVAMPREGLRRIAGVRWTPPRLKNLCQEESGNHGAAGH